MSNTQTFHKNWPAICRLEDGELMRLVATTTDEDTLAGLRRGFPELFTSEKQDFDGRWPVSIIHAFASRWNAAMDSPDEFLREQIGLPIISLCAIDDPIDPPVFVPKDELDALLAQYFDGSHSYDDYFLEDPTIIELQDRRRFIMMAALDSDIIAVPVECIDLGR